MGTTREEIRSWLERGRREVPDVTHMIVACDTFDHGDYPVYVRRGQDAGAERRRLDDASQMSRVMEVYSYALDLEAQLAEPRAFHEDVGVLGDPTPTDPTPTDPTPPESSARWVGPDGTHYAIVSADQVGDRPRYFMSRARVDSYLDGADRQDCGPRTPGDLHRRPLPILIARGDDGIVGIVGIVIPDEEKRNRRRGGP